MYARRTGAWTHSLIEVVTITLGKNIASLRMRRLLEQNSSAMGKVFERLSSGLRINSALDDAAGLSVSSRLLTDSRLFNQALRNANDGMSMLNIADSALAALTSITQRQMELAEQAANGAYTLSQRRALDQEANALVNEFNRIVSTTSFNGVRLLDLSASSTMLQIGTSASDTLSINLGTALARTVGSNEFGAVTSVPTAGVNSGVKFADLDSDGKLDIIDLSRGSTSGQVMLGNGDLTFKAPITFVHGATLAGSYADSIVQDLNGDGLLDLAVSQGGANSIGVFFGNGNGSFKARTDYSTSSPLGLEAADVTGDGIADLITHNFGSATISVLVGNGNGTFRAAYSFSHPSYDFDVADFNNDGKLDIVSAYNGNGATVALGNGNGSFRNVFSNSSIVNGTDAKAADFNHDGNQDFLILNYGTGNGTTMSVFIGNGDGTFGSPVTYTTQAGPYQAELGDINNDGVDDVVIAVNFGFSILIGNSNGSFAAPLSIYAVNTPWDVALGDVDGDGVLDIAGANAFNSSVAIIGTTATSSTMIPYLDLLSSSGALSGLVTLRDTLDRISAERGAIGSTLSRLETVGRLLSSMSNVYRQAASRITDADIAAETAELLRRQILQQSATAILSQANQEPELALVLLADAGLG